MLVKNSSEDGDASWATDIAGNAATATKLATVRTISLTGDITGSGSFDGSDNLSITTTTNHTHSYAGSSSAGGSANSAVKLDTATAGDSNTPVYFTGGKPVACTALDLNTSGNAATATKLATARKINSVSFDGTKDITFVGSYTTATDASSIPKGISFIELPSTATSTGDPTYGTCLTVSKGNTRAF